MNKDSAYVQIHGPACYTDANNYTTPIEVVEWNIQRIQMLYSLTSISIIQEPYTEKSGDHEVTKAVIEIPASALEDDANKSSTRNSDLNATQVLNLYHIIDGDENSMMVYVYQGNHSELNTQAQEIVDSIQIICSDEP